APGSDQLPPGVGERLAQGPLHNLAVERQLFSAGKHRIGKLGNAQAAGVAVLSPVRAHGTRNPERPADLVVKTQDRRGNFKPELPDAERDAVAPELRTDAPEESALPALVTCKGKERHVGD